MQEFLYLGTFALVLIWFRMVLTQILTWVYEDFLTLTYPPNIKILIGITILISRLGSLIPSLILILDSVHSHVY